MPLSVNVGLSKKASRDYQSTGVSINVTAELDQSLLAKPNELQAQIDALYGQAEQAIARQVQACGGGTAPARPAAPTNGNGANGYARNGNGNGQANANGHTNGNGHANGGGMTSAQRRAIESITRRAGLDADQEATALHGIDFNDLSIRQASELIDHLKDQAPATNGRGVRR